MYYSAKNVKVKINDRPFVCTDVQLEYQAQIQPNFYQGAGFATTFSAVDGMVGTLKLSYHLTGLDPLKSLFNNYQFITGNVGGLIFNSGYLKSFNFSTTPNSNIQPNAEIVFFDLPHGTFTPETVVQENIPVLNCSNVNVNQLSNYSQETFANVSSLSYSYNSEITPFFTVSPTNGLKNLLPERVRIGQKQIVTELVCDNLNTPLSISGLNLGAEIQCKHPTQSITEVYRSSGILTTKNFQTAVGQPFKTTYTITQNKVGSPPRITSLDNTLTAPQSTVGVNGIDFDNLLKVYLGTVEVIPTTATSTLIEFVVPWGTPRHPKVTVVTLDGSATSEETLNVAQETILGEQRSYSRPFTAPQVTPIGGEVTTDISGDQFFDVSAVYFGDVPAPSFERISKKLIRVSVPSSGKTSLIQVRTSTQNTGLSTINYVYPLKINSLSPNTGVTGQTISILGSNFTNITTVMFALRNAVSHLVVNSGRIDAVVPSGYVKGPIFVSGSDGFGSYSPTLFYPKLVLSRISPQSGFAGQPIELSGKNFIPELMYGVGNNQYLVTFNNVPARFTRTSQAILNGTIPTGNISGPVFILGVSGDRDISASGKFIGINRPEISGIYSNVIYSGKRYSFTINGRYLSNPEKVILSGIDSNNIGTVINFQNRITGDVLGVRVISTTGFRVTNTLTGAYRLGVSNFAGTGYFSGMSGLNPTGVTILPAQNLALRGSTSQSSTTGSYHAYFSNDGINTGTQANSLISWTVAENNPYWKIDLKQQYEIQEIKVYNRADNALGLSSPLTNFGVTLYTGNEIGQVWQNNHTTTAPTTARVFPVPNLTGRFVKVVLTGTDVSLAMSDVEIY